MFARTYLNACSWSTKVKTQSHIVAQAMDAFFISGGLNCGILTYLLSLSRRSFGILPLPYCVMSIILAKSLFTSANSFRISYHVGSPGCPRSIHTASMHDFTWTDGLFKDLISVKSFFFSLVKTISNFSAFAAMAVSIELSSAVAAGADSNLW